MTRASVGFAAALALACGAAEEAEEARGAPVAVERVDAHRLAERIHATGELVAVDDARVAAEVDGRITALRVEEGAPVAAGDVVLEIDRERRELELANARAVVAGLGSEVAQQRREVERITSLFDRQAASRAQLDATTTSLSAAEARLAAARAQLGLAQRALRDSSVKAPFAGMVARRFVSTGDHVSEAEPLFELIALDPIEVEFHLAERDSARVAVGDEVAVRVAPYPDEVFPAKVFVVSPRIDPETRTLRVRARLANSERKLRPGLFARAELGVATRERVAMIPEGAVLQRSDGSVAFVVREGDRAERRTLQLGVIRDGMAEVVSGIDVGEQVIVRGMTRLVDGALVEPRRIDGSKPSTAPEVAGAPEPTRAVP